MADNTGFNGQQIPGAGASDSAAVAALARSLLLKIQTTELVQVIAVRNDGALAAAGFIDVQIMVNQIDGAGNQTPHGVIKNIPYLRMQGGVSAIILDPNVGDIGVCGFCAHDVSAVKASRKVSNPGSRRRFDYADAVYIGGVLNGAPQQYVQFNGDGIKMYSPHKITLEAAEEIDLIAPVIKLQASTSVNVDTPLFTVTGETYLQGAVTTDSTIDAGGIITAPDVVGGGKSLANHTHNMVAIQTGGTTKPTTGPL